VNGEPAETSLRPGRWAVIRRQWAPGDRVEYTLPMRLRTVPIDSRHPNRVAVMVGPVVLVQEQTPRLAIGRFDPQADLRAADKPLSFLASRSAAPMLEPFYRIGFGAPYSMYFDLV